MTATYFTIAPSDPDMNTLTGGAYSDEVLSTLGLDGLPLLNPAFPTAPLPQDLSVAGTNGALESGEITWWSPSLNPNVTETATGTITLPYTCPASYGSTGVPACYPPNGTGTNDGGTSGFQSIELSTILDVTSLESISFTYGADDVAFIYLDGTNVCQLGGVHNVVPGTCTNDAYTLTPGDYTLEVFYADLEVSNAALTFDATISSEPTPQSVPEPGSFGLACLALAGFVVIRRRCAVKPN
jgi:fibro-slime domain-containing protein